MKYETTREAAVLTKVHEKFCDLDRTTENATGPTKKNSPSNADTTGRFHTAHNEHIRGKSGNELQHALSSAVL